MTRPGQRPPSAAEQRLAASLSGAVDLAGLKTRAEAKADAARRGVDPSSPAGSPTVVVDELNFESDVLRRSLQVPVLVEFTSRRAPSPLTATLDRLAASAGGAWVHAVVDVDSQGAIAEVFQVQAVPTVVAVAAGRPLADFEGDQPEDALAKWIGAVLEATAGKLQGAGDEGAGSADDPLEPAEPADPERDAAEDLLADGDLTGAVAAYRALVEARPADHSLVEALRYVEATERLEDGTDAGDGAVATAFRAADQALTAGDYPEAFRILVDAVRVTAGDERTAVRERLVEVLGVLPADDPQVLAARRDLASALY